MHSALPRPLVSAQLLLRLNNLNGVATGAATAAAAAAAPANAATVRPKGLELLRLLLFLPSELLRSFFPGDFEAFLPCCRVSSPCAGVSAGLPSNGTSALTNANYEAMRLQMHKIAATEPDAAGGAKGPPAGGPFAPPSTPHVAQQKGGDAIPPRLRGGSEAAKEDTRRVQAFLFITLFESRYANLKTKY
ncbi:hypothetical protein cyc_08065 [Cyclospora cayetanensis]|uniref:Uncharacterized protein n=1 Tax=Cyclospora cayetanensis TaxID=88456 RepID=A0A1D3D3Z2_9EIME|nr:hypothetical protein cyc_08065 [Cyclospora cayetanensis]